MNKEYLRDSYGRFISNKEYNVYEEIGSEIIDTTSDNPDDPRYCTFDDDPTYYTFNDENRWGFQTQSAQDNLKKIEEDNNKLYDRVFQQKAIEGIVTEILRKNMKYDQTEVLAEVVKFIKAINDTIRGKLLDNFRDYVDILMNICPEKFKEESPDKKRYYKYLNDLDKILIEGQKIQSELFGNSVKKELKNRKKVNRANREILHINKTLTDSLAKCFSYSCFDDCVNDCDKN